MNRNEGTMDGFLRLQRERYASNGVCIWETRWGVYKDGADKPVADFADEESACVCADDWAEHGYAGRVAVRPFVLGRFLSETRNG
jgi:hypothetical protein